MPSYKQKVPVIQAFQLGTDNIPDWFIAGVSNNKITLHVEDCAEIKTLRHGVVKALQGDFVMQDTDGEIYPCDEKTFKDTYEAVGKCS